MRNPWKTLDSRITYQNPWLRVREDNVLRPDGRPGIYGVIEIRPSVGVLAFNEKNELAIVGQWRYALERYSLEIVRGGTGEGETDLLAAAQRELQEETGFAAEEWESFGSADVCNGVTTDVQYFYVARKLRFIGVNQDPFEEVTTHWHPFEQAVEMAMSGEISEVCSVAAILKYDRAQTGKV
jgi:8-oxo-dGTP pyrophosphatase MutT (NUDIX family)